MTEYEQTMANTTVLKYPERSIKKSKGERLGSHHHGQAVMRSTDRGGPRGQIVVVSLLWLFGFLYGCSCSCALQA